MPWSPIQRRHFGRPRISMVSSCQEAASPPTPAVGAAASTISRVTTATTTGDTTALSRSSQQSSSTSMGRRSSTSAKSRGSSGPPTVGSPSTFGTRLGEFGPSEAPRRVRSDRPHRRRSAPTETLRSGSARPPESSSAPTVASYRRDAVRHGQGQRCCRRRLRFAFRDGSHAEPRICHLRRW